MNQSSRPLLGIVFLAVLALVGCSDVPGPAGPSVPHTIELSANEVTLVRGEQVRLLATVRDRAGAELALPVQWYSRPSVAGGVDEFGWVRAVGVGEFTVTASVYTSVATVTAEARVKVVPAAECRDLNPGETVTARLHGVQLLQVTENIPGGIPLVSGRPALARVWVVVDADAPIRLAPGDRPIVALLVKRGQTVESVALDGPECLPNGAGMDAQANSYDFVVPAEWLDGPELEVWLDYESRAGRLSLEPASRSVTNRFVYEVTRTPPLHLVFVPLDMPGKAPIELTVRQVEEALALTRAIFPLDKVRVELREPVLYEGDEDGLLPFLTELRTLDGSDGIYHGLTAAGFGGEFGGRGDIGGVASWSRLHPPSATNGFAYGVNARVVAHELGHNFGLKHTDCGRAPSPDLANPYGCWLGAYGYDPTGVRIDPAGVPDPAHGGVVPPTSAYDIMSYGALGFPRWISEYHYAKALRFLQGAR